MGWSIHKLMHCKKNPIQTYFIAQHSLMICKLQTYAVDNAHTLFLGEKIMNTHKTSSHSFLWNGVGHLYFVRRIFLLRLEEKIIHKTRHILASQTAWLETRSRIIQSTHHDDKKQKYSELEWYVCKLVQSSGITAILPII